jgi:hypothetical protein
MQEWFNDDEVQSLLTRLLDRLCSLERMGGDVFGSQLLFMPSDKSQPVLFATHGKPFYPYEHLTTLDIEIGVKLSLQGRLPA